MDIIKDAKGQLKSVDGGKLQGFNRASLIGSTPKLTLLYGHFSLNFFCLLKIETILHRVADDSGASTLAETLRGKQRHN